MIYRPFNFLTLTVAVVSAAAVAVVGSAVVAPVSASCRAW